MKENNYPKKLTVRVTQDQYDFLEKLDNASEWMRNAIDSKMFEETSDVLAIVRRIRFLEKEKSQIYNSEEYKLAERIYNAEFTSFYDERIKNVEFKSEAPPIILGIKQHFIYGSPPKLYFPPFNEVITQADLKQFMNENNLKIAKSYGRDIVLKLFEKLKREIAYMREVHEKYNRKIAEIQKEINSLKNKMKTARSQLSIKETKK